MSTLHLPRTIEVRVLEARWDAPVPRMLVAVDTTLLRGVPADPPKGL